MKTFKEGQTYTHTDWFTGGTSKWRVEEIKGGLVTFSVMNHEQDGDHDTRESYPVQKDAEGNESVLLYEYHGHENRIAALDEDVNEDVKKEEALKRLRMLDILPEAIEDFQKTGRLYYSEGGILYWVDNNEHWQEMIKKAEAEYDIMVYHAILSHMEFGDCLSLLYVSSSEEEWEYDIEDMKEGYVMTYTINLDDSESSEFGSIGFKPFFGGLKRTA